MPTDLPNNLVRTIPVIFERLMGGESAAEIAADYTREGAPLLPDDFAPIADAIARLRRLESRPVDPVAALRAVLAENAKIPHLEARIAHMRKHNANAELESRVRVLSEASMEILCEITKVEPTLSGPTVDQVRHVCRELLVARTLIDKRDSEIAGIGASNVKLHRERDDARSQLEVAEQRIEELEDKVRKHNASAELEAIRAALAESPVPNAPADCDLAGWVRYLLRGWRSERKEASELAQLCQEAHNTLTSLGVPDDGTPAIRILYLAVAYRRQISELEAEIAHLRKRDPSEELDAVQDALNEHPASPDIGDLSLAEQVRQIIKWWDETEVENNDAHNVLDELGAPDEGTPAKRIRALAAAKDRQIAELEAKVRALAAERTQATTERPDYLTPGASELACPQCGCVVYWQMHEVHDGAEGSAHCSRSSYTARAPSMPMVGDGGCEWRGRVRRVGGRVEVVT